MKIFYYTLLIFFTSICISNAQWTQVYSGPGSNALYGVFFVSQNVGWIVGKGGTIKKTTDGGYNWSNQNIDLNIELNNLYFLDANTGVVFGENCSIYRTTNGGVNWILKYNDTSSNDLYFISNSFVNSLTGYVVGNKIMKTTDGGNSWIIQYVSLDNDFRSVSFVNEQNGWTGYKGVIFRTTNAGLNWTQQTNIDSISIVYIKFVNSSTGILLSTTYSPQNKIKTFKTTNGGNNWTLLSSLDGSCNSSFFSNEQTGWAIGRLSNIHRIYKTTDGGLNWNYQTYNISLWDVFFLNNDYGWIVGGGYPLQNVLSTTSGGNVFINNISSEIPNEFALSQNYPNPFNPTTNIEFSLTEKSFVKLKVFDITGKEVAELVNENLSAGTFRYEFNAVNLPSGLYFYKFETDELSETKRMILIK